MLAKKIDQKPIAQDSLRSHELAAKLRKFQVFSEMKEDAALSRLADFMIPLEFSVGSAILSEGKVDDYLYILMTGRVEVIKTTESGDAFKVVELTGAMCAYFGEGAILDSHPRSATITAVEPTTCLALSKASFDEFSTVYPHWGLPLLRYIARQTAQRLRKVSNDYVFLYHAYVREIRGS
jgi:CRP-like cAMP-binding protein